MGAWFISFGVALIILGGLMSRFPRAVSWFGRLPGDIRVQRKRGSTMIPVASVGALGIVAMVIVALLSRFLMRW